MKFGGTSVEDARAFARVARIVSAVRGAPLVIVVSAMSRVTDALLGSVETAGAGETEQALRSLEPHFERHALIARTLQAGARDEFYLELENARREIAELLQRVTDADEPRPLLQDAVVAHGESLSAKLLAATLHERTLSAAYVDARRCIITNEDFGCATPLNEETYRHTQTALLPLLAAGKIPVLGGFIASSVNGHTTTLGRGGSDYSAALVGAGINAREIQIWTDVNGVLTADPRVIPHARTIPRLSYAEAAELAYFGAKVIHPKTILPAVIRSIPVRICNSRTPEQTGTDIYFDAEMSPRTVKAIAHKKGVTILHITSARMLGAYGFLRALLKFLNAIARSSTSSPLRKSPSRSRSKTRARSKRSSGICVPSLPSKLRRIAPSSASSAKACAALPGSPRASSAPSATSTCCSSRRARRMSISPSSWPRMTWKKQSCGCTKLSSSATRRS
jgi:aspartate kinase